jgi:hypothetical protein
MVGTCASSITRASCVARLRIETTATARSVFG